MNAFRRNTLSLPPSPSLPQMQQLFPLEFCLLLQLTLQMTEKGCRHIKCRSNNFKQSIEQTASAVFRREYFDTIEGTSVTVWSKCDIPATQGTATDRAGRELR